MTTTNPSAVPFAQGQDVARLRAAVDRSSQYIKDYTKEYEDQRAIVEALSNAEQAEPGNKFMLDILFVREGRLDVARTREIAALALLSNCLIADSSAAQAQGVATAAMALPAATTTPLTTTPAEKKIIKRKLPGPHNGWKDSAGKLHRAQSNAMSYQKTISAVLWQITNIVHQQNVPPGLRVTPTPDVKLARLVPLAVIEYNITSYKVGQLLEMGLNYVHEASYAVYLKPVYNNTVAETFLGDDFFGADRSVPVEDIVDKAVKRVQKLLAATKAAVGLTGKRVGPAPKNPRGRKDRGGWRGGFQGGGRMFYNGGHRDNSHDRPWYSPPPG
jgi:hypothetical protein